MLYTRWRYHCDRCELDFPIDVLGEDQPAPDPLPTCPNCAARFDVEPVEGGPEQRDVDPIGEYLAQTYAGDGKEGTKARTDGNVIDAYLDSTYRRRAS